MSSGSAQKLRLKYLVSLIIGDILLRLVQINVKHSGHGSDPLGSLCHRPQKLRPLPHVQTHTAAMTGYYTEHAQCGTRPKGRWAVTQDLVFPFVTKQQ